MNAAAPVEKRTEHPLFLQDLPVEKRAALRQPALNYREKAMMHKNMTRIVQLLASASTVSLLAGAAMADVVKIGVLAPLTGATASDGEEFVRGVTWAVEEANAKGGVAGHTFEVEVADVKDHSAANVSSAVERLLGTDGVEVIVTLEPFRVVAKLLEVHFTQIVRELAKAGAIDIDLEDSPAVL